jgi:RNA polymerase sigma factor (sigma-70 family)
MDYRRKRSTCQSDLFEWPGAKPEPLEKDLQEKLEGALAELSADERECIVLKIFDGMTLKEIAVVRGVSINTAASWYRRGLVKMKTMLEDDER